MSGIAFQNVGGLVPGRTRFDWHKSKKFDCCMGQLIPIFAFEMYPGDTININAEALVRCTPLINPVMHEVSIDKHYFFVPTRLLDDCNSRPGTGNPKGDPILLGENAPPANRFNFELYTTGGHLGQDAQEYPRWIPTATSFTRPTNAISLQVPAPYMYSLWDYFDLPTLPDNIAWASPESPIDDLRRAYNWIYNEYYRDETLIDPVPWTNEFILNRCWRKDYFTSSLPFQQRGIAPALPLSGILNATWADSFFGQGASPVTGNVVLTTSGPDTTRLISELTVEQAKNFFNKNVVDLANAATFNVSDIREVVQLQKYLERNARAGVRLNEFTKAHWGKNIGDERLGRPEYIGGSKSPLIISEVLNTTSGTPEPLGDFAGHGISANGEHIGSYHANEWGWVIGIMSVMPAPAYHQGIKRNLLKKTRLDWLNPAFVNLSEQEILQAEIYIANNSTDSAPFAFTGIFDELRTEYSTICGAFRNSLMDWHLTRHFENRPTLSKQFIEVDPLQTMRIFAVQNEPPLLCEVDHNFYAIRPLPEIAEPGLLDHH